MMTKERLEILLCNCVTYFDTELLQGLTVEEKIDFLQEEIGLEDSEIKELDLKNQYLS